MTHPSTCVGDVIVILLILCSGTMVVAVPDMSQEWSAMPPMEFPGGKYKYSNIDNFPGSDTLSATLFELYPGGLRELHWHDVVEWAYVIEGTCRSTVIEQGPERPAETWDFHEGDVWYFRPNEGHMIQGLEDGCTYLSGYNRADFEERQAFSMSAWLSTANVEDAAQGLQVEPSALKGNLTEGTFTFLPLGPVPALTLDEYRASVAAPPAQPVLETHRFQLSHVADHTTSEGGWVKVADKSNFAVSSHMSGALVHLVPGGMRELHWHTTLSEWQYVINGTLRAGVFLEPGTVTEAILHAGDAGFAPRGSGHYFINTADEDAYVILIFDDGEFTNVDVTSLVADVPPQVTATTLDTSVDFARTLNAGKTSVVPPMRANTSRHMEETISVEHVLVEPHCSGHIIAT